MGRLGKDPELKTFGNKHFINASLITVHKSKENWHNLQVWDKVAINMHKHCKKGDLLHIQGHLDNVQNEDNETGEKWVATCVVVDIFQEIKV